MKDFEPGVTAPPFHVWCRSCTVPYFDDEFNIGERVARGEDGKTYYVDDKMKYGEWKKQYVDTPILVDQTQTISKKATDNDYSVDRQVVNNKSYHNKFENLTGHKAVNESIYQESMKILEHRDGTDLEDVLALDARVGKVIVKNDMSVSPGKTGFTQEQFKVFSEYTGKKVLLHNHPNGGRLSYTDISTLFNNTDIVSSVAVGHDGAVHIISNPDRTMSVDKLFNSLYDDYKQIYQDANLARLYALDDIYDMNIFKYESW